MQSGWRQLTETVAPKSTRCVCSHHHHEPSSVTSFVTVTISVTTCTSVTVWPGPVTVTDTVFVGPATVFVRPGSTWIGPGRAIVSRKVLSLPGPVTTCDCTTVRVPSLVVTVTAYVCVPPGPVT